MRPAVPEGIFPAPPRSRVIYEDYAARWLDSEGTDLAGVDVDVLLRFLTACRGAWPWLRSNSGRH